MEILLVPHPALRQKANKLKSITKDDIKLAKLMMGVMIRAPGVGLAANQLVSYSMRAHPTCFMPCVAIQLLPFNACPSMRVHQTSSIQCVSIKKLNDKEMGGGYT